LRLDLGIAGGEAGRGAKLEEGGAGVSQACQAFAEHAGGQDVVGSAAQHALQLDPGRAQLPRLEERPSQGQAGRRIVRVSLQARPRHSDRLGQLAFLAQLLGQLGEEA
jgi:hypothetical protein